MLSINWQISYADWTLDDMLDLTPIIIPGKYMVLHLVNIVVVHVLPLVLVQMLTLSIITMVD